MAYAALASLPQTIRKLLRDPDRYPISLSEKELIISIHEQVIFFQEFLEDYSKNASSLEGRMRDAANEAEDIIEYFVWKQIRISDLSGVSFGLQNLKKVAKEIIEFFIRISKSKSTRVHLNNLRKVAEEIESIAAEATEIKNYAGTKDVQQLTDSSSIAAPSSSRLIIGSTSGKLDTAMVGFEDDLTAIKGRLCGESSKLQVIPICGMGGIGKTTLAKNAYDDQLIVEHFQIRAWVTVSQDYSTLEILSSLVVSVRAEHSEERDESKMFEIVYKSLKGRRYLIVMDDIWCTKAWDDMRRIFPDDHNSSRIVLTTRLSEVAAYPDFYSPLHEMRFMDLDESWTLLQKKVFPQGNCPPELEDTGKTIAGSCRGLPLAIVVIAGVLSTVSQTPSSWKNITSNVNEAVTTNDEQFAEIVLSLSYNHLPHHLRPCFLYLGIFPEDYEIRVSKLIKLWVAEGFLKLPNGPKTFEEVAEEYLEDLVKRSLVLVTRRKPNGKIKICSVHDLVRDLCVRKAQQEKFLVRIKDGGALKESMRNQRRVIIASFTNLYHLKHIYGSHIHTIICTSKGGYGHDERIWGSLRYMSLLRVFDVPHKCSRSASFPRLPQVIEIFHLRHLALPSEVKIPEAISNLENLQTLIIYQELKPFIPRIALPFQVWKMQELRHLISYYFDGLPRPEVALGPLENLQTLSHVKNFKCTQEILLMIPNLKKLGIYYFGEEYIGDCHLENLVYLHKLEKLRLKISGEPWAKVKPVFPATLKKLTLSGKQRSWEDMGIIGSLSHLEVLKLRTYACFGDKWETSEGQFPQLKFLLIEGSDLRQWTTKSSHFPSLKCLVLRSCWYLTEIPNDIGEIPTLELIEIDKRNKAVVGSAKRIQEEQQQDWGNYALQIRCGNLT